MIKTGRDSFARQTVRKRLVVGRCSWCGNFAYHHDNKTWQYYIDADSVRESGTIPGKFCNIDCLNAYHG